MFAFIFAINSESVSALSSVFVVAEKINIISINTDFVEKLFFDEKNDCEIVILNYMSDTEIITLFVVVVQASKKNESKKNKKIMKKILNKQIEKKKVMSHSKSIRTKKWKSVLIKNALKKSEHNVKMKNVSKIQKKNSRNNYEIQRFFVARNRWKYWFCRFVQNS